MNYYEVLGVSRDADQVVIQAAYKALMKKYHPDVNGNDQSPEKVKLINEAYSVIGDLQKRKEYDNSLANGSGNTSRDQFGADNCKNDVYDDVPNEPEKNLNQENPATILPLMILASFVIIAIVLASSRSPSSIDDAATTDAAAAASAAASDAAMAASDAAIAMADASLSVAPPEQPIPLNSAPSPLYESGQEPTPTPTLSAVAPAVDFDELEAAVGRLDRVIRKSGVVGARAQSKKCRANLSKNPVWSAVDGCLAFDLAASTIDNAVVQESHGALPRDAYFKFRSDNPEDDYVNFGVSPYAAQSRISKISNIIVPIINEKIRSRSSNEESPDM